MMLRQWMVVSLAVCATAVASASEDEKASNTLVDQRRYDLRSIIQALQYLNTKIQEEVLRRLATPEMNGVRSPAVVSMDDATFTGSNEPLAFVRDARSGPVRNPLRFGKRQSVRQPLRFGKRADESLSSPVQQGKRLSAVRNPLRFGKRADLRQPLRFGKRFYSEPQD